MYRRFIGYLQIGMRRQMRNRNCTSHSIKTGLCKNLFRGLHEKLQYNLPVHSEFQMNVSLFRIAIYIIFFCIPFKIYSESEEKSVHPRQIYSFSVLDSPFNTQRGSLRTENNSPVPSMNQLLPLTKNAIQNSELFCIFSGSFEEQILTVYCSEVTVTFDIAIFPEVIFARAAPLPFI